MVQQDWSGLPQPAHLSQITIMGLESRVQLNVAGRSKNFLVDTGATCVPVSVLTYSRAFSSQTCTIWGATGKAITKDSPKHFFVAGMDKYFPTSFWWSLSVLIPYWEEIFPCLQNLGSYCSPDRRCFKTLFGGQTNYFYQPPSETTPKWERPFMYVWSKDPQISSSADGKSRPDYIPFWCS